MTNDEIWKLNELMQTFYTLKKYHALIYRGNSNITKNSCYNVIKNDQEYNRLTDEVFPALFKEIYTILGGAN